MHLHLSISKLIITILLYFILLLVRINYKGDGSNEGIEIELNGRTDVPMEYNCHVEFE